MPVKRVELLGEKVTKSGFRCGDFMPVLEAVISPEGLVTWAHLVPPRGKRVPPKVAAAFEGQLRQWHFEPAMSGEKAVEVLMYFTIALKCQ